VFGGMELSVTNPSFLSGVELLLLFVEEVLLLSLLEVLVVVLVVLEACC